MKNNTMQYDQPNVAILGNASELIQSDKPNAGESGLDAQQGFDD